MFPITTILSSLLALIFVFLSTRIVRLRKHHKISIGGQGIYELEMAIRAHGNFSEYVPLFLVMLLCAEAHATSQLVVATLALSFLIGRLAHLMAFLAQKQNFQLRKIGMILTFVPLLVLAWVNLLKLFWS